MKKTQISVNGRRVKRGGLHCSDSSKQVATDLRVIEFAIAATAYEDRCPVTKAEKNVERDAVCCSECGCAVLSVFRQPDGTMVTVNRSRCVCPSCRALGVR